MKVILLQELKGKGGEGDVVDVAPGFANNYLLPQKVAILATKGNLKQLEQRKHNIAKREENRLADAGKIKETLDGALVKVEAKVGEEGQLFGSVTAQMIADAIKAATEEASKAFYPIAEKMYQQANPQGGQQPGPDMGGAQAGSASSDPNVVDADYEVVDDDNQK